MSLNIKCNDRVWGIVIYFLTKCALLQFLYSCLIVLYVYCKHNINYININEVYKNGFNKRES